MPEGFPAEMAALHAAGFKLVHYDAATHYGLHNILHCKPLHNTLHQPTTLRVNPQHSIMLQTSPHHSKARTTPMLSVGIHDIRLQQVTNSVSNGFHIHPSQSPDTFDVGDIL